MHNDNTEEQTITELQNKVRLTQMSDDELVSRLCMSYEDKGDDFKDNRYELMRRLAQRNETDSEADDTDGENA